MENKDVHVMFLMAAPDTIPEWFKPILTREKPVSVWGDREHDNVPLNSNEIQEYQDWKEKETYFQWREFYALQMGEIARKVLKIEKIAENMRREEK